MADLIMEYISPELLALIPALYIVGYIIKQTLVVPDNFIPLGLLALGVFLSVIWVLATAELGGWQTILLAIFTALVQGFLVAGAAVFINQIYKQSKEDD